MGEVEYRSRGELTEEEQADFERYIRGRIEAIRGKDAAVYRNHTSLAEVEPAAHERGQAPTAGDLRSG